MLPAIGPWECYVMPETCPDGFSLTGDRAESSNPSLMFGSISRARAGHKHNNHSGRSGEMTDAGRGASAIGL